MAVIQISKIQLRRGKQQQLDVNSLDTGEMGFATDTGRLFIGTDPNEYGLWSGRTLLPYDNIEVLTEASLDTFARLHDRMSRMCGPVGLSEGIISRRPYAEAIMDANITSWTNLPVLRTDANGFLQDALTEELVLSQSQSVAAIIEYFIFNDTNIVRSGTLTVTHDGNLVSDEAMLSDEHVADFQIAATGTPILAPTLFATGIKFRAIRVGISPNYSFYLQYQNDTSATLRMQMRLMVAAKV